MKKLLLSAVALIATSAFAQRNIDWATTAILEPDSMRSTATGTTIQLAFEMKNLGPDTVMPGDTVLWQFSVTNTNPRIYYPGQTSFAIVKVAKKYGPNDTMNVSVALSTSLSAPTSLNATLQVISLILNTGSITPEPAANQLNNAKTGQAVWYNQQGWNVGLSETISNSSTNVYPNPVSDKVFFETNYTNGKHIKVVDFAGKVVANISNNQFITELDVNTFTKGLYLYEIRTDEGATLKTGKFFVQ